MSDGREFELKYGVDERREGAVVAALVAAGATRERLEARYFDTAAGALADERIALRLRRSGADWEQTLKAPGRQSWDRLEESVPAVSLRGAVPEVDPSRHGASRAGRALRRAIGEDATSRLLERFTTHVDRLAVEVGDGRGRVEVALDRGQVAAGDAAETILEVEYERKEGGRGLVLELARRGVGEHGLWLSTPTKSERGERLARGLPVEAATTRTPRLERGMDGGAVARCIVAACFEQIAANQSALAAGTGDDEVVHQLRVGLRRLRTVARELAGLDAALAALSMDALTATFRVLGRARDAQLVVPMLARRLREAGSPAPQLVEVESGAPVDVGATVRDAAFQLALVDLVAYIERLGPRAAALDADAVEAHVAGRLDRLRSRIGRAAERFERLDDAARHRARKTLKRLRYLSEAVARLYPKRRVARYLKRLKPAQDALGEHVDLLVGLEMARAMAAAGREGAAFNVGWLEAQRAASAVACRRALRTVVDASPFWD